MTRVHASNQLVGRVILYAFTLDIFHLNRIAFIHIRLILFYKSSEDTSQDIYFSLFYVPCY